MSIVLLTYGSKFTALASRGFAATARILFQKYPMITTSSSSKFNTPCTLFPVLCNRAILLFVHLLSFAPGACVGVVADQYLNIIKFRLGRCNGCVHG